MAETLKTLIIDDSEDDALLLVRHLGRSGFDPVVERVDSPDGLQSALEAGQWDIILCDVNMPNLDTVDALKAVETADVDVPVIVVSGTVGEERLVELMKAGAHDIVVKDRLSRLVPAIRREIEDAAVRRERRQAENRLQDALDNIAEGFALFDAEDRLVVCNDTYRNMNAATSDVIVPGMRYEDIIRTAAHRGQFMDAVGREEEWVAERLERHRNCGEPFEQCRTDGRWMLISERKTRGGGTVSMRTDITRLKTVERQYRESESFVRLIADNLPILIVYFDLEDRYRFVNRTGTQWYARPREEILGHSAREVLGEETYDNFREWLERVHGGIPQRFQTKVTYPDGVAREVEATYVPDYGSDGEICGFIAMVIDVTDRKEIEAQLVQAQKMEAVGQLTGGVAHDFNNLLTVIMGNARLLERNTDEMDTATSKRLDAIVKATQRGSNLTHRLLAFSRKEKLDPVVIDARRLVSGMLDMIRRTLGEAIGVETRFADGPLTLRADENQLEAALLNLATNARDAMDGNGTLTFAVESAHVGTGDDPSSAELPAGDYVVISVSDTGCGIPPEIRDRIFEPFFTSKDVGKGTGLGLSMVFGFAMQSGGQVRFDSEVGKGTTFRIYLPAAEGEDHIGTETGASDPADIDARATIFVVEDEPAVRAVAVEILEELGHEVVECENGPDALAKLDGHGEVDFLFTDMIMPKGMNGLQLAAQARERFPGIRILFTTGYTSNSGVTVDDLPPGSSILAKPYESEELAETVARMLASAGGQGR